MTRRLIGIFLTFAIILSALPGYESFAAASFSTSDGSAVIYAVNTTYSTSYFGSGGYTKKSSSESASGNYLYAAGSTSSAPSDGKMSFNITTNEAGRYSLWARVSANGSNGATWFSINGSDFEVKRFDTSGSWGWVKLSGGVYLDKNKTVSVKLYPKNEGHSIDEFIFTDKPTYLPSGKVTSASQVTGVTLTASYGMPTITPPSDHPRVMFRSEDIPTIIANSQKSQNTSAKSHLDTLVEESFSGTVSGANSSSVEIENHIEANAFYYAIYGDSAKGRKAVDELLNYLKSVQYGDNTRLMGCTVFKTAEVYDWCYPLLTSEEKNIIINCAEGIMAGMEMGYPNTAQGNITGHGSEAQIFRDMLSFSIAVYNERPDIYNHIMGRIQNAMVPARNYYYKSNSVHQGTNYGFFRFYWELWAQKLILAMSGQSLFSEDMKDVGYYQIYNHRPDGRMFVQGDDSTLSWSYYNGYSFQVAFFAGALFDNEFFKGEYRRQRGSDNFNNTNFKDYKSFNSVFWLIVNNPDVAFNKNRDALPESRYFGSPNGTILAKTGWDYTEEDSTGNNTVSAMMKIGERYAGNHDHLDAGTFQLFYRGILASGSGVYDDYGSEHDAQYAKRTIAHNALTIYDSSESFSVLGNGTANDGGQKWAGEPNTYEDWMGNDYKRGTVIDHEIASDNSYSYIKGDITPAYSSSKVSKVVRSMSFLQTDNSTFPAIMVIYDKVVSKKASQTKKFLIHTQAEPTISGNTTTVVNNTTISYGENKPAKYNGRMVMNTLLPENPNITKIGGSGKQYSVNGTNYAPTSEESYREAGWGRVEVTPSDSSSTSTEFLNVLAVSDGGCTQSVSSTLIRGTNVVGAKTLKNVVLFSTQSNTADGRIESSADFTVSGSDKDLKITVFGVKAGNWIVKMNGSIIAQRVATEEGASISFEGAAGNYVLYCGELLYEPFSSANNVSTGHVGDIKGNPNATAWTRTQKGTDGAHRTSVTMTANEDVTDIKPLVYAYNDTGFDCRFVHSAFIIKSDAPFQIRIRNADISNTQWMNFNSGGSITANSSGIDRGIKWTQGKEHKCDILADLQKGIGYLYIDGVLASKSFNLQKNGKWYGYLIYSAEKWESGDALVWRYYKDSAVSHTLFKDTIEHITTIEDAATYVGISDELTSADDTKLLMRDSRIGNYFTPQSGVAVSYPSNNSVIFSIDSKDTVVSAASLLSGFYHDGVATGIGNTVNIGGRWIRASFDQTIEQGDRAQIRLRAGGTDYFGISLRPSSGKMAASVDYDEYSGLSVLDKAWTDKVRVDVLVDITLKKAYYFIDGKQVGGKSSYPAEGEVGLNDLIYYVRGQNATISLENCEFKVYNLKKEFSELYAEITGKPVYWTEKGNTLEIDDGNIGMCVTAKNAFGTSAVTDGKIYAAAYDTNDRLIDIESWNYVDGESNEEIVFERTDDISKIKVYCWLLPQLMPLSNVLEFNITDYINE